MERKIELRKVSKYQRLALLSLTGVIFGGWAINSFFFVVWADVATAIFIVSGVVLIASLINGQMIRNRVNDLELTDYLFFFVIWFGVLHFLSLVVLNRLYPSSIWLAILDFNQINIDRGTTYEMTKKAIWVKDLYLVPIVFGVLMIMLLIAGFAYSIYENFR